MTDKEFVCAYNHCLHHGQKVLGSESVVVGKKHYHWDCAEMKQKIKECADLYIEKHEDKSDYPAALKIINTLVFNHKVPVDYILNKVSKSQLYYSNKPPYILYGLRKMYWEKDMPMGW